MQFLNRATTMVLNRLLGDYVTNVDSKNVSFSLSGHLTLNNLQLKSTALDKLGLPVKLRAGTISKLHLQIPIRSSTPAIIEIEGLYMLVCPASRSADDVRSRNVGMNTHLKCYRFLGLQQLQFGVNLAIFHTLC